MMPMKNAGCLLSSIMLLLCCLMASAGAGAEQAAQPATSGGVAATKPEPASAVEFSRKGADTCIKCHDEDSDYPVLDIFKTKHGVQADSRTPFATMQCETCHGPGVKSALFMQEGQEAGAHVGRVKPGEKRPPILNFGDKSDVPVATQNQMCLQCHAGDAHIAWQGSAHEVGDIACASCHTIHATHDPVLDKVSQPDVCFKCHLKQRAEFLKPSVHPVRFGQLGCTDCHNTHGSATSALLKRPTLNETCYTCHADKRGPFLWEHPPASEDCTLCHTPHGSINPSLLKKRPPLLCQQCHSLGPGAGLAHTRDAQTTAGLPGGTPSAYLLAGACTNCHSQVHGSNHPSGVKLMR